MGRPKTIIVGVVGVFVLVPALMLVGCAVIFVKLLASDGIFNLNQFVTTDPTGVLLLESPPPFLLSDPLVQRLDTVAVVQYAPQGQDGPTLRLTENLNPGPEFRPNWPVVNPVTWREAFTAAPPVASSFIYEHGAMFQCAGAMFEATAIWSAVPDPAVEATQLAEMASELDRSCAAFVPATATPMASRIRPS